MQRYLPIILACAMFVPFMLTGEREPRINNVNAGTYVGEVPLLVSQGADVTHRLKLTIAPVGKTPLKNSRTLALKLVTKPETIEILSGRVVQLDSGCAFTLKDRFLRTGSFAEFERDPLCVFSASVDFELQLLPHSPETGVALVAYNTPNLNPNSLSIIIPGQSLNNVAVLFVGSYTHLDAQFAGETQPRYRLLAAMWGIDGSRSAYAALFIWFLLWLANFFGLRLVRSSTNSIFALNAFATIIALGALYSVVMPPFQGADEADHFLVFNRGAGNEDNLIGAKVLADIGHYSRLMCFRDEHFSALDALQPTDTGWPSHVAFYEPKNRSALLPQYWDLLKPAIGFSHAAALLVFLRMTNVLCFAVLFGLTILAFRPRLAPDKENPSAPSQASEPLLQIEHRQARRLFALVPIFVIPTLWHFVGHVSNHFMLVTAYASFAYAYVIQYFNDKASQVPKPSAPFPVTPLRTLDGIFQTVLIAILLCVGILAGRAGLIFSGVCSLIWIGHLFVFRNTWKEAILYTSIIGAFTFLAIVSFLQEAGSYLDVYLFSSLKVIQSKEGLIKVGALFIGILAVLGSFRLLRPKLDILAKNRSVTAIAVASLIFLAFYPIFRPLRIPLQNIEDFAAPVGGLHYAYLVVKNLLLGLGIGGNDFYLINSFWGGFACPEEVISSSWVQVFKLLPLFGLGALLSFVTSRQNHDLKRPWWLLFLLGISFGYLAVLAYATATVSNPYNLHGRYLIGFYMLWLMVSTIAIVEATKLEAHPKALRLCPRYFFTATIVIQCVALCSILNRYFGMHI